MRLCCINFSGRKDGNCKAIADLIQVEYSEDTWTRFDFSNLSITPCGKCELECFKERNDCPYRNDEIYSIYDAITNSDMTYLIVPNYCDYPNANYFAFNERSQCYFQGRAELLEAYLKVPKKFLVVSNTNTENFEVAFAYQCETKPDILFLSAKKYGKRSIDGDILSSEETKNDVIEFIRK